jgi:xanthine dehydrogenase YagS FAD-binding subunit
MLPKFAYIRPESMTEALEQLASDDARVFAGGTDLLGCLRDGVFDAPKVVSLSGLDEMHGIEETAEGGLRIGALTTLAEIASSDVIRSRFTVLAEAAGAAASPQLRNQGTVGGNLCQRPRCWYFRGEFHCLKKGGDICYAVEGENQYHAILGGAPCFIVHPSDTAPALVALGASVRLARGGTERTVPLEEFFVLPEVDVGNENILEPGEIITEVIIPSPQPGTVSTYRKVRERGAWDFALTSLALVLKKEGERAAEVSAVFGGVAPVPWRSRPMQEAIAGERLSPDVAADAANAAVRDADPLEKNGYKVDLVKGVVEETLLSLA